ncbi:MAG: hypothetical protein ACYCWW_09635 [Deltaproteobacteria bacterium]
MKRIVISAAWLALAALTALGCTDVCGHAAGTFKTLNSKIASCTDGGASIFCFDQSACEKALPSCSQQDQELMNAQLNCYDGYLSTLTCSNTNGGPDCTPDGGTLSQGCARAFASSAAACGTDGG